MARVTFLVMSRVDGQVPTDSPPYVFGGWVFDLTDERAALQRNTVEVLAKLHRLTPETADLSFLDRPEHGDTPLRQHLNYQRYYYDWARGDMRSNLIERAFDWLEANLPPEGPTVLNWGDSRIGNMLFDGTTAGGGARLGDGRARAARDRSWRGWCSSTRSSRAWRPSTASPGCPTS